MKKAPSRKAARLRKEQRERLAVTQAAQTADFAKRLAEIERRLAFMELLRAPRMPSVPVPYFPVPYLPNNCSPITIQPFKVPYGTTVS